MTWHGEDEAYDANEELLAAAAAEGTVKALFFVGAGLAAVAIVSVVANVIMMIGGAL